MVITVEARYAMNKIRKGSGEGVDKTGTARFKIMCKLIFKILHAIVKCHCCDIHDDTMCWDA